MSFGPGSRQIAQVLPYLYLSDISCACDAVVSQVGFTHIVSILSGPIPWLGPSPSSPATVLSITCDDDPDADITPHFDAVNAFIQDALATSKKNNKNIKILIHCLAGVSRSPTICAAYLIKVYNMRRDDALALIRERREVVEPNHGFLHQLAVYEARARGTAAPPHQPIIGSGMCATMIHAPTPTPTPTSAMGMNTPTPTPTTTTSSTPNWTPCIVAAPTRNTAPRIRIPLTPSRAWSVPSLGLGASVLADEPGL